MKKVITYYSGLFWEELLKWKIDILDIKNTKWGTACEIKIAFKMMLSNTYEKWFNLWLYLEKNVIVMQIYIFTGGHFGKSNMAFPVEPTVK